MAGAVEGAAVSTDSQGSTTVSGSIRADDMAALDSKSALAITPSGSVTAPLVDAQAASDVTVEGSIDASQSIDVQSGGTTDIQGVIESTVGMYGDLQGIAGRALPEIEGLETPLLESDPVNSADSE